MKILKKLIWKWFVKDWLEKRIVILSSQKVISNIDVVQGGKEAIEYHLIELAHDFGREMLNKGLFVIERTPEPRLKGEIIKFKTKIFIDNPPPPNDNSNDQENL